MLEHLQVLPSGMGGVQGVGELKLIFVHATDHVYNQNLLCIFSDLWYFLRFSGEASSDTEVVQQ